jgi:predicted transcriptional regulator
VPRSKSQQKFIAEALVDRIIDWPDEALNELMRMMDAIEQKNDLLIKLDDETRAAVQEGLAQAKRGEFVSDEEMEEFFARHGVARKRRRRSSGGHP